jgi:2-haloacid dehalogenase
VTSELPLLVFDVNETLLDIEALAPQFQRMYGDAGVLREWFAQLILYSEAITLTGNYVPFGELAGAVARMVAEVRGVQIDEGDIERLQQAVASLPPHPEVPSALGRLRDAGFRLFTLTNNPQSTCKKQLDHAGLSQCFERGFSVDDGVRQYKPAPQVYCTVQESLGAAPARLWLIACHTWDILGASAAGWKTALILRTGNAPLAVGGQPDISGSDLNDVAEKLCQIHI